MKTTLHTEWTVEDICKGFTYNELEVTDSYVNLRKTQKQNRLARNPHPLRE